MALIQPKPYMDKLRLRHSAVGVERRRNMSKIILENGTPLPKSVTYSDIDESVYKWLRDKIDISYDGKRIPTYKLYSTQRISEYMETWKELDDSGNPIINFKTITRENNPQKGENQGNYYNIPGNPSFTVFYSPVLQENGTEAFDKYTMKQPIQVNFTYSMSIVTNKMDIVNDMSEKMMHEFSAIDSYICPNGHYMPLILNDVTDTSEYTIDDRKYYSQTYTVKLKGYVIREEDFTVERVPSRLVMSSHDSDASGIINKRGKNRAKDTMVEFIRMDNDDIHSFNIDAMKSDTSCDSPTYDGTHVEKPSDVPSNEDECKCNIQSDDERYKHKVVKLLVRLDSCEDEILFTIDGDMVLERIEMDNMRDFMIYVNGELIDLDEGARFYEGDSIRIKITRDDLYSSSEIDLIGYDPNIIVDTKSDAESSLDEPYVEEEIIISTENSKDE